MLKFRELKEKEVSIFDLKEGQVFVVAGTKYSFVRVKRGAKSMVVTDINTEKSYSLKIHGDIFSTKTVIGKVTLKKTPKKVNPSSGKSILIKDVSLNESVVIMTGRGNAVPQLYTLVEINKGKAYSHTFKNPVTEKRENFKETDSWKVYRLKDIVK